MKSTHGRRISRALTRRAKSRSVSDPTAAAADAARALLSDPDAFKTAATAARDIARATFSARAEADGIGTVYDRLWATA